MNNDIPSGPSTTGRIFASTNSSSYDLRSRPQASRSSSRLVSKRRARSVGGQEPDTVRGTGLHKFSTLLNIVLGSAHNTHNTADEHDLTAVSVSAPFPSTSAPVISRPLPPLPPRSPSPTPTVSTSRFSIITPPPPGAWIDQDPYSSSSHSCDHTCNTSKSFFSHSPKRTELSVANRSPNRSGKGFLPRLWDALSSPPKDTIRRRRGKGRAHYTPTGEILPLDGEEGELIDDEACFVDILNKSGLDIVSMLPPEIALYLFVHLDLDSIIACLSVSKKWRKLAGDNVIWRELFHRQPGWKVNASLARQLSSNLTKPKLASPFSPVNNGPQAVTEWNRRLFSNPPSPNHRGSMCSSWSVSTSSLSSNILPPLSLDWMGLYKTRLDLSRRWLAAEPKVKRLTGHGDSVYCLEFDAHKIVTGSRDKTIKIWSVRTGRLRQTLYGHEGSVLCLKFDSSDFMVSGSSDRQIFVWDLGKGLVKTVLKGHLGGVLDLRIDEKWIVSCSKDAIIRVWRRETLEPHCSLVGHDGPVNAVGMQNGKIVSASGDGRMIFWDIEEKLKIRTFDGHDRGLACIEFKDDLIISGSNDCKIKIWSATTGECLQTLVGHSLLVRALSFDPQLGRLVSASYDRSIKIWDLNTGKCVREFRNNHDSHIFDVKFDVRRIVSTSHDQNIVVLDFAQDLDTTLLC